VITERECQATLAHLEQDVDGFIGAVFVETSTGRQLAAHSVQTGCDLAALAAAAWLAVTAYLKLARGGDGASTLEEIVVADADYLHLSCVLSSSVFLTVSAARSLTNLAMLRAVVRRRSEPLKISASMATTQPPPDQSSTV
jgi:hypothetical protein